MRNIIRRLLQPILWFLYRWYSRKERRYTMDGLTLYLAPSVFHPSWMLTTRTMTAFALEQPIAQKKVLELGAGNGFLALSCSRAKAIVTATDINPEAVSSLLKSSQHNQLSLEVLESDLFAHIPAEASFDFIFINPPYFPREPKDDRERAFYCGSDFQYFRRLFDQLIAHRAAKIFMILTDDCELEVILKIATEHGWHCQSVFQLKKLGEEHLIFRLFPKTE